MRNAGTGYDTRSHTSSGKSMTRLVMLNPFLRVTPSWGDAVRLEVAGSGFSLDATHQTVRWLT